MSGTLIHADQTWFLLAILILSVYFGIWGEKTKIGSKLSGAVLAIIATFVLSNLYIIPPASEVYDTVWTYIVPLAIPI